MRGTMLPLRRYTGTLSIVTATSCGLPSVATGAPAMQKDGGGLLDDSLSRAAPRYSQTWAQGTCTLARAGCCRLLLHVILMPQAAPPLAKEQCTLIDTEACQSAPVMASNQAASAGSVTGREAAPSCSTGATSSAGPSMKASCAAYSASASGNSNHSGRITGWPAQVQYGYCNVRKCTIMFEKRPARLSTPPSPETPTRAAATPGLHGQTSNSLRHNVAKLEETSSSQRPSASENTNHRGRITGWPVQIQRWHDIRDDLI